jgi:hypothetical protein
MEAFFSLGVNVRNAGHLPAALETFAASEALVGESQCETESGERIARQSGRGRPSLFST